MLLKQIIHRSPGWLIRRGGLLDSHEFWCLPSRTRKNTTKHGDPHRPQRPPWRIIPFSKWLGSPPLISHFHGHLEGGPTTPVRWWLINHCYSLVILSPLKNRVSPSYKWLGLPPNRQHPTYPKIPAVVPILFLSPWDPPPSRFEPGSWCDTKA